MLSRARVHLTVEESFHPGFKQATGPVSPPRDVFWFISPSAVSRRLRTSSHSEISAGQRHFRSAPSVVISSQQSYLYKTYILCDYITKFYLYLCVYTLNTVSRLIIGSNIQCFSDCLNLFLNLIGSESFLKRATLTVTQRLICRVTSY